MSCAPSLGMEGDACRCRDRPCLVQHSVAACAYLILAQSVMVAHSCVFWALEEFPGCVEFFETLVKFFLESHMCADSYPQLFYAEVLVDGLAM